MRAVNLDEHKLHRDKVYIDTIFTADKCSGGIFNNCHFLRCSFKTTTLDDTSFAHCKFFDSRFEENIWSGVRFTECVFTNNVFFNDYYSSNIVFTKCKIDETKFSSWLSTIDYDKAFFRECKFSDSKFFNVGPGMLRIEENSVMIGCSFTEVDMRYTIIKGSKFVGGTFNDVNLEFSQLENVFFKGHRWNNVNLGTNGYANSVVFSNSTAKGTTGSLNRLETIRVTPYFVEEEINLTFKTEPKTTPIIEEKKSIYAPVRFMSGGL